MELYYTIKWWLQDLRLPDVAVIFTMGVAELAWVAFMVWAVL